MAIEFTANTHEEILDILLANNEVEFFNDGWYFSITEHSEGGWNHDTYHIEDCPKDKDGIPYVDDLDDIEPFDGGQYCGTAQEVIEMILDLDEPIKWNKRDEQLLRNCCSKCIGEN